MQKVENVKLKKGGFSNHGVQDVDKNLCTVFTFSGIKWRMCIGEGDQE